MCRVRKKVQRSENIAFTEQVCLIRLKSLKKDFLVIMWAIVQGLRSQTKTVFPVTRQSTEVLAHILVRQEVAARKRLEIFQVIQVIAAPGKNFALSIFLIFWVYCKVLKVTGLLLRVSLPATPRLHIRVIHLQQVLPQNTPLHTCPLQAVVCQHTHAATRQQPARIRLATRRLLRTLPTGLLKEALNIADLIWFSFSSVNKPFSTRTCCRRKQVTRERATC